jgi:hypothetical protein
MKKLALFLFASLFPLQALADGPHILASDRPFILGSYVYQPVPIGLLTWQATDTAPGLTVGTQTSDAAPPSIKISAAPPYTSAVTNLVPGNVIVSFPSPVSGTTFGYFDVSQNGNTLLQFGADPLAATVGGIWSGVVTPSGTNYGMVFQSNFTQMNVAVGGTLSFNVNNVAVATATGSLITLTQPVTASSTIAATGAITHPSPQTLGCGTGGTVTVASSPTSGFIVTSGTLASNCTLDFGTNATSGDFVLDMSGVTLGTSFGVIFKNGTSSSATFLSGSVITTGDTMAHVWTHGANTLAVTY